MSDVLVARGCLSLEAILAGTSTDLLALVTQPGASATARALADEASARGLVSTQFVLPDGEAAKRLSVVEEVVRWAAEAGIRRDGLIVAVGGGTVCDVAGFVAAVYLRGVDAVYAPTTLLAAVDAAIGGKTGVNVDGKNMVGVFRLPRRVVIDVDVLDRLPMERRREGMAEVIKAGLIGDPVLVDLLERDGLDADLEETVHRAVAVKQGIVARDFEDRGERAHLNYGHTVGHAIESAAGVGHGDAVAVGMVAAGRVSALVAGFAEEDRQREVIASLGLPVIAPAVDRGVLLSYLERDKKRDRRGTRMVVLEGIASPRVVHVEAATVGAALDAVGIPGGSR